MADENLDPAREEQDPGYLEDAAVEDEATEGDTQDQRKPFEYDPEVHGRDYRVEGNDIRDYYGVDPEYRTYANESDAPIMTDTERLQFTDQYDHLIGNHPDEEDAVVLTESQRKILRDAGEPVEGDETQPEESSEPVVPEGASEAPRDESESGNIFPVQ